jgi:pyruvate formate lyase activating enzyme
VVPDGGRGFCGTRVNIGGALYTLVFGNIASASVNPIEKKPFFHFWPGSLALTVGTWSCNFTCPWCQNWELSRFLPEADKANYVSPERLVEEAAKAGCQGVSLSFNEPTLLFEYAMELFPLARGRGLYNTFVSNGYMSEKALEMLREAGMDAIKFDVKGDVEAVKKYCGADVEVVWRNIRRARELGMHVEIVTLVVPGVNDDEDCLRGIARRLLKTAGPETPIHFTRFHPNYRMVDRHATPTEVLDMAHDIAYEEGLRYVYVGNVPGHRWENTYCPDCGEMLIRRFIFDIIDYRVDKRGLCPRCKHPIPIVGKYVGQRRM